MYSSASSRNTATLRSRWSFMPLIALLAMVLSTGITPLSASASTVDEVTVTGDVRTVVFPGESPAKNPDGFRVGVTSGGTPVAGVEVTVSLVQTGNSIQLSGEELTQITAADGFADFRPLIVTGGGQDPVELKFEAGGKSVTTEPFIVLEDFALDSIEILMDNPENFASELTYALPVAALSTLANLCFELFGTGGACISSRLFPAEVLALAASIHTHLLFGTDWTEVFSDDFECKLEDPQSQTDLNACAGEILFLSDQILNALFDFRIGEDEIPSNMLELFATVTDQLATPEVTTRIVPFVAPEVLYSDAPQFPEWFLGDASGLLRFIVLGDNVAHEDVSVTLIFEDSDFRFPSFDGFAPIEGAQFTPLQVFGAESVFSVANRNFFAPVRIAELQRWGIQIDLSSDQLQTMNDDFLNYAWSDDVQELIDLFIDDFTNPSQGSPTETAIGEFFLGMTEQSFQQRILLLELVIELADLDADSELDDSQFDELLIEESLLTLDSLLRPFCEELCQDSIALIADLWLDENADVDEVDELTDALTLVRNDINQALTFYAELDGFLNSLFSLDVETESRTLSLLFLRLASFVTGVSDFIMEGAAAAPTLTLLADDAFDDFADLSLDQSVSMEYLVIEPGCTHADGCSLLMGGGFDLFAFGEVDLVGADLRIAATLGGARLEGIPKNPPVTALPELALEGALFTGELAGDEWIGDAQLFDFTSPIQRNFTLSSTESGITTESGEDSGNPTDSGGSAGGLLGAGEEPQEDSGSGSLPETETTTVPPLVPAEEVTSVTSSGASVSSPSATRVPRQISEVEREPDSTPEQELPTPGPTDLATTEEPDDDSETGTTASGAGESSGSSLWPLAIGAGVLLTLLAAFAGAAMLRTRIR